MVRRRRNERRAWPRMAQLRDKLIYLMSRELPAFAWLRALGKLNLQVFRVSEVVNRHTKASARDLLNSTVGVRAKALLVESAFT